MLRSRSRLFAGFIALLFIALAVSFGSVVSTTQAQKKGETLPRTPGQGQPPTVRLEADATTLTVCAGSSANSRIQLRADAHSPEGRAMSYRWTANAGRVEGEGATTTWDLAGVSPGVYTATVEVNSGIEGDACMAFTSVPVIVNECPPVRPVCPNVSIYCPDTVLLNAPVTFTAEVSGGTAGMTPTFNWKVSAGTITSGQGTPSITVDTAGLGGQPISATIEVLGYTLNCTATCTTQVPAPPDANRFDLYNDVRFNDEKARLDNFAVQLQNEPGAQGYIVAYSGRRGRPGAAALRATRARNYLVNERGLNADRIIILEGGVREDLTVELWMVPTGATPPRPTM